MTDTKELRRLLAGIGELAIESLSDATNLLDKRGHRWIAQFVEDENYSGEYEIPTVSTMQKYASLIVAAVNAAPELLDRMERLTDLVRYMRAELHDANLISDEEYAALVQDSDGGQRVARLEGYDAAIASSGYEQGVKDALKALEGTTQPFGGQNSGMVFKADAKDNIAALLAPVTSPTNREIRRVVQ